MEWKGTYSVRLTPAPFSEMERHIPVEMRQEIFENSPAAPPEHRLSLRDNNGVPYAVYETEHGEQVVGNLCYSGPTIRFTALGGTPGDELFIYAVQIENGRLTGEAYQPGKPHSPLTGELLAET